MIGAHPARQLAAPAVAFGFIAFALSACTSEDPKSCGPAARDEAQAANQAFFEKFATGSGYRAGITGHGLSKDDEGWFILALVSPGRTSADRPDCFEGVPVDYETGGPFTGG